jgi:hypothetical protein
MIILRADGAAAIDAVPAVLQQSGRLSAKSSKLLRNLLKYGGNSMISLGQQESTVQDAQNGRPARPQRVKGRGVPSGVR